MINYEFLLNVYLIVSSMLFCFFAMIWGKSGGLNIAIKFTLFCGGIIGLLLTALHFGYIVKLQ